MSVMLSHGVRVVPAQISPISVCHNWAVLLTSRPPLSAACVMTYTTANPRVSSSALSAPARSPSLRSRHGPQRVSHERGVVLVPLR